MADPPSATATFADVAAALRVLPDVDDGTGFGAMPGLRTGGKIFAMLVDDHLVVKLPADRCAQIVRDGGGEPFSIGRRTMREWVRVAAVDGTGWTVLAREARAYVGAARGASPPRGSGGSHTIPRRTA